MSKLELEEAVRVFLNNKVKLRHHVESAVILTPPDTLSTSKLTLALQAISEHYQNAPYLNSPEGQALLTQFEQALAAFDTDRTEIIGALRDVFLDFKSRKEDPYDDSRITRDVVLTYWLLVQHLVRGLVYNGLFPSTPKEEAAARTEEWFHQSYQSQGDLGYEGREIGPSMQLLPELSLNSGLVEEIRATYDDAQRKYRLLTAAVLYHQALAVAEENSDELIILQRNFHNELILLLAL